MFLSNTIVPVHECVAESPELVEASNLVLRLGVRVSVPSRSLTTFPNVFHKLAMKIGITRVLVLPRKDVTCLNIGNCRQKQRKMVT